MMDYKLVNKTWTLFLDRDGVINEDKIGSYIFNRSEFVFMPRAEDAIKIFSDIFGVIVIVTNQRGVGKGLMTLADLDDIHAYMREGLSKPGGRIDKIYFAPDLHNGGPNRKPLPGMAYQAKEDFPQIDFTKSIMVGNKLSDMEFGRNIHAKTVFIPSTNPETDFPHPMIDDRLDSLYELAKRLQP
ncbi:MAG: HAD-IIIA family hydrolase, partial [Panacibacter sp.]